MRPAAVRNQTRRLGSYSTFREADDPTVTIPESRYFFSSYRVPSARWPISWVYHRAEPGMPSRPFSSLRPAREETR